MQLHLEEVKQIRAHLPQPPCLPSTEPDSTARRSPFCSVSFPRGWRRKDPFKLLYDVSCDMCWSPGLQGLSLTTVCFSTAAWKTGRGGGGGGVLVKIGGEERGILTLIWLQNKTRAGPQIQEFKSIPFFKFSCNHWRKVHLHKLFETGSRTVPAPMEPTLFQPTAWLLNGPVIISPTGGAVPSNGLGNPIFPFLAWLLTYCMTSRELYSSSSSHSLTSKYRRTRATLYIGRGLKAGASAGTQTHDQ